MRLIIIFLMCFILLGCQTSAQKQLSSMQDALQVGNEKLLDCITKVETDPNHESVAKRYPINWVKDVTVSQFSDNTYPIDQDIPKIISVFNGMALCRQIGVKMFMEVMPAVVPLGVEGYTAEDILTADLIQKKLTWADYNKKRTSIKNEFQGRIRTIIHEGMNEILQSHQAELNQRKIQIQQALNILSEWAYRQQQLFQNQQLINALTRPVITNCNGNGYSFSCSSY